MLALYNPSIFLEISVDLPSGFSASYCHEITHNYIINIIHVVVRQCLMLCRRGRVSYVEGNHDHHCMYLGKLHALRVMRPHYIALQ